MIDRRQSTCRREIILSPEVGEKLPRGLSLYLEIFEFRICLVIILQLQEGFIPRPEAVDPVEAQQWRHNLGPYAICIGSKSRARNDCINLPL